MKTLEVDDELYHFIAGKTEHIGESASSILRRLLGSGAETSSSPPQATIAINEPAMAELEITEPVEPVPLPGPIEEVVFSPTFQEQSSAVRRFLAVLSVLYRWEPDRFVSVLDIQGRKPKQGKGRKYFALSESELQSSGKSTAPKEIAGSPYWVITNTNTKKKRTMVSQVASKLQLSKEQCAWLAEQI